MSDRRVSGPFRAEVLGSPIAHSLSPVLHRAAYAELGLDGAYTAHEVDESGLAAYLASVGPEYVGASLTMPLKKVGLALAASASAIARTVGAANTLVRRDGPDGGWFADNTDVPGLVAAVRAFAPGLVLDPNEPVTVLGAGATAASALAALQRLGAREVDLVVRRAEAGAELAPLADTLGLRLRVRPWTDARASLSAALVVATVPRGAADHLGAEVGHRPGVLFDVLYEPWPTPLAAGWLERGGQVVGGLELLVHQAVLQVELMTGVRPSAATLLAAGRTALDAR